VIVGAALPLADDTADTAFANGVMEHLDLDEIYWFLMEFRRVVKPGGAVVFDFNDVMTDLGIDTLIEGTSPRDRTIFRVHHTDSIRRVAERAGYLHIDFARTAGRITFAEFTSPA
jgi:predicted SAM-dependent methyltransferase